MADFSGTMWSGKEDSNLRPLPPEDDAPHGTQRFSVANGGSSVSQNGTRSHLVPAQGSSRADNPCLRGGDSGRDGGWQGITERCPLTEPDGDLFRHCLKQRCDKYTYFAIGKWVGRIKIGQSNNPWRRRGELMFSNCGEDADIVVVLRGSDFEGFYHDLFAEHLYGCEWFNPHPDILDEIEAINSRVVKPFAGQVGTGSAL